MSPHFQMRLTLSFFDDDDDDDDDESVINKGEKGRGGKERAFFVSRLEEGMIDIIGLFIHS